MYMYFFFWDLSGRIFEKSVVGGVEDIFGKMRYKKSHHGIIKLTYMIENDASHLAETCDETIFAASATKRSHEHEHNENAIEENF